MALTEVLQARETITGEPGVPPSMDKLAAVRGAPPVPPQLPGGSPAPPQGGNMPVFVPEGQPPVPIRKPTPSLNENLKKIGSLIAASLAENAIKPEVLDEANREQEDEAMALQQTALQNINPYAGGPPMSSEIAMEAGGIIGLAAGGEFSGRVPGRGHGMEDNVRMPIEERGKQVATLAVSPSEYVVDSHTMAALGNGNADRGADVMDKTVKQIRQKAYGTEKQPREISGLAALKPLIERV